jgi:hypothetical protein
MSLLPTVQTQTSVDQEQKNIARRCREETLKYPRGSYFKSNMFYVQIIEFHCFSVNVKIVAKNDGTGRLSKMDMDISLDPKDLEDITVDEMFTLEKFLHKEKPQEEVAKVTKVSKQETKRESQEQITLSLLSRGGGGARQRSPPKKPLLGLHSIEEFRNMGERNYQTSFNFPRMGFFSDEQALLYANSLSDSEDDEEQKELKIAIRMSLEPNNQEEEFSRALDSSMQELQNQTYFSFFKPPEQGKK